MQIDLTADEIARIARLLHLANEAADAPLWEKIKEAHIRCVIHPSVIARNAEPTADPRCSQATAGLPHNAHTWYSHAHMQPCGDVRVCGEARECPGALPGLTDDEAARAYRKIRFGFDLKAQQRDQLSRSDLYAAILYAAHRNRWKAVEMYLGDEGIIRPGSRAWESPE